MKKLFIFCLLVAFISVFAAEITKQVKTVSNQPRLATRNQRNDEVVYFEDFEGEHEWVSVDGTLPSSMWHTYSGALALNGGPSWWMGDEEIGGYINKSYVVLDTPPITVTAENPNLTFKVKWATEDPASADEGYDGWDGCNVRISTDGGNTFSVISGSPAYNCSSLYAFGAQHNEGLNIAGWGGTQSDWQDASFNLSAHVGNDVIIRFAFASDPNYSTANEAGLFGMMVDDIALGSFTNDASNDTGFTASSIVPVGGDLWHLDTDPGAPSATHVMNCQNEQGTYNINMLNYLVSPTITLPLSGEIRVDFQIKGNFSDPDQFPDVDNWGFEVSPDNGITWNYMSNPYADPNGDNYVYSDAPETWSSVVESYSMTGRLDDFAGQDVKFRIYFESDEDTPVGTGIMIDDFKVTNRPFLPVPFNLTSELTDDGIVLNWVDPFAGGETGWMHWDNGVNNDGVGAGDSTATYDAAIRFDAIDLLPYSGSSITKVKFFPRHTEGYDTYSATVKVWDAGTVELASVPVANLVYNEWNEVTLPNPIEIEQNMELYVGYSLSTVNGYPLGVDEGPLVRTKGAWIRRSSNSWSELGPSTINANLNIQCYTDNTDEITFAGNNASTRNTREFNGFKVLRRTSELADWEILDEDITTTTYTDTEPVGGETNYYAVVSVYDTGESAPSNVVSEFVYSVNWLEYTFNDGDANESFQPASGSKLACKFTPRNYDGDYKLVGVKFYIDTLPVNSSVLMPIWLDNGDIPGSQLALLNRTYGYLTEGWNTYILPTPRVITQDSFWIGLQALSNSPTYGVDTDNHGNTIHKIGTADWTAFTQGNIMLDVIIDHNRDVDAEDNTAPEANNDVKISNYPNPFNPTTNIKLNLAKKQRVSLSVYNVKGQLVKTLINNEITESKNILWNGVDNSGQSVSSGIYFYRLNTENKTISKKMLLLK